MENQIFIHIIKVSVSVLPIVFFYMIYYRYFIFKPEYIKHFESFLYGVTLALLIILLSPYMQFSEFLVNIEIKSYVKAAVVEKAGAFFFILFIHKYYRNFSIMESIISAMLLGLGFATAENLFYALNYGYSIVLVRIATSVPLHMTTCGIMGFYWGLSKTSGTSFYRFQYGVKGLFYPILLHGLFDLSLKLGGYYSYFIIPVLIFLVVILEFIMARTVSILPANVLEAMNLRFEDWIVINKEPRYERWIHRTSGLSSKEDISLIKWQPGTKKMVFIVFFLLIAVLMSRYRDSFTDYLNLTLGTPEQFLLMVLFPLSISTILFIVGSINPEFIENNIIKIPIISDVIARIGGNPEEIFVTYNVTPANCFLRTFEPLGEGTEMMLRIDCPGFSSPYIKGTVRWENHDNKMAALGTLVSFTDPPADFKKFILRYYVFRFTKGILYTLKLPGFENVKRLFMRPISTIQSEQHFKAGETVFREGDKGDHYYLLKSGFILLYMYKDTGNEILMDSINAGEVFGEQAIIDDSFRTTTAYCASDCVVGTAHKNDLDVLVTNNPEFALSMMYTMARRIHQSEKVLSDIIKELNRKNSENTKLMYTSMILALIGQGISPSDDEKVINLNIDYDTISDYFDNIDKEKAVQILNILVQQKKPSAVDTETADDEIHEIIEKIYNAAEIKITEKQ